LDTWRRVKCGPPAWGLGEGLTIPHCKIPACYEILHNLWICRPLWTL